MISRLTPYGLADYAATIAKVGKFKASYRLAARMPSPEVAAKVGSQVGHDKIQPQRTHRVVRIRASAKSAG